MKNKKGIIIILILLIITITIIATICVIKNAPKPEEVLNSYIDNLNSKNYEAIYELLSNSSKSTYSKEDFITRNENIHEGIEAFNIKVSEINVEKQNNKIEIKYKQSMNTVAGNIEFSNTMDVVKEDKQYKINWNSSLIYPDLKDDYKLRVKTLKGKRGAILDKNGNELAYDGTISSVGIVPGKLGENRESNIQKIAQLLEISTDYINTQLGASYVKDDTFVPIKKISKTNETLKTSLLQIPGIMINDAEGRVYTLGEEAAHLIGYVQNINAEELEKKQDAGYNANSLIGKTGLEAVYEDRLKATDGVKIYLEDQEGNMVKQIAMQEQKNGEDITLTIDSNIQKQLYNELKNDKGLFVVMQPQTGKLLALVSTPSYNSNDFTLGMTNEKWESLNNDKNKPLFNRFIQSYCPGSTFKPITGAIGLTTEKLSADEELNYTGTRWQKDSSWGDYSITTLTAYSGKKNLLNGMIHSDNIYFAQAALKIGSSAFTEGLRKIGFGENIDFPLSLTKSQFSNSDTIENEGKLANSGYGQGDILVNPIHMASIYSAFANDGNMVKPIIEENQDIEILKQNVFSKEAVDIIKQALIQVVENPEGTANDMKISGKTIAGKTGTAELKKSRDDTESGTLGWFNCFTIEDDENKNLLVISMVENIQDNRDGGSHYLIPKIKKLLINSYK